MIIHVVNQGDTMESIAKSYGVPVGRLMQENDIADPGKLVIGQTIVIVYPELTYTIQEGDTLQGIADNFGVNVMQLLRNNPYLSERDYIYPGETIVISYAGNKNRKLSTNGYAYPFINRNILRKTLPFLTYLTIFTYTVNEKGELNVIEDEELIQIAREYGVAPIMMLMGMGKSQAEQINVTNEVLSNPQLQEQFIDNLLTVLKNKGYYGVNINVPYINPQNREAYPEFMEKFALRIRSEGYTVWNTLTFNTFETMVSPTGILYEEINFGNVAQVVDAIMVIAYDWGYTLGFPVLNIPINLFRVWLEFGTKIMSPQKLMVGMSSIGYIWELPNEPGISRGQAISYQASLDLAYQFGAEIKFNDITTASYFRYVSNQEYVVQFRDARGIDSLVNIVSELNYNGLGLWNIMSFFALMWLVINTQYEIEKIQL